MNQESMPGPVAMACHTCSGVASTAADRSISKCLPISAVLLRHARVDGDDDAVRSATRGALVVVLADEGGPRGGQFPGERRPVGRGGEADLAVDGEGGDALAGRAGAGDQRAD